MIEAEHCTSMDELFNKTDGVLEQHTSAINEANGAGWDMQEQDSYVISDDGDEADWLLPKKQW